eukprot:gene28454-35308_t
MCTTVDSLSTGSQIMTIAGTGTGVGQAIGNGGLPTSAGLFQTSGLWINPIGAIYVTEISAGRLRKIDPTTGFITIIAGQYDGSLATGTTLGTPYGDGGQATSAYLNNPSCIVGKDSSGVVYMSDFATFKIRKVGSDGIITTVAGTGGNDITHSNDGASPTGADLIQPKGIWFDSNGNLYVGESSGFRLRKISSGFNIIITVAGTGVTGSTGDGGSATSASFSSIEQIFGSLGWIYLADRTAYRVRSFDIVNNIVDNFAGLGTVGSGTDIPGPKTSTLIGTCSGVVGDSVGNFYIATYNAQRIKLVTPDGQMSTFVNVGGITGTGLSTNGDGGPLTAATLNTLYNLVIDSAGSLLIADGSNNKVRKVYDYTPTQIPTVSPTTLAPSVTTTMPTLSPSYVGTLTQITTAAGMGGAAVTDLTMSGPATSVSVPSPRGVCTDSAGNIFLSENGQYTIRMVSAAGNIISLVAGTGISIAGLDGVSTSYGITNPFQVISVPGSLLLFVEATVGRVRQISLLTGNTTTLAGSIADNTSPGDGGQMTSAKFNNLVGVYQDSTGNIYTLENSGKRVRRMDVSTKVITLIMGGSTGGSCCLDGAGTSAVLAAPYGITGDTDKSLYVADSGNNRVRKQYVTTGLSVTYLGNGIAATNANPTARTAASVNNPRGIKIDSTGQLYATENSAFRIKKVL